jgi:hypothetical protein
VPEVGGSVVRQRFAEPGDAISQVGDRIQTPFALFRGRAGFELRHGSAGQYYHPGKDGDDDGASAEAVRDLLEREDETYSVKDLPTAYLNSIQYRFRFAVLDGRVTHSVGRPAETRPAREYFGGKRREIEAYRARFGADAWQDLVGIAEHAAAAFPGLRSVGVDLAPDQRGRHDIIRPAPDPEEAARHWQRWADNLIQAGRTPPPKPDFGRPLIPNDLVYDIDPFGPRLPGALGLEGPGAAGLEVPAAMLRMWAERRAG